jgi:hypothetical protein
LGCCTNTVSVIVMAKTIVMAMTIVALKVVFGPGAPEP